MYIYIYTYIYMRFATHVTHRNEACRTSEWVVSHIRMSHVTTTNQPCHIYMRCHTYVHTPEGIWSRAALVHECAISYIGTSHVPIWRGHVTYECVHTGRSHGAGKHLSMNALCPTYERVMSQYKWVMSRIYVYTPEGAMVPDSTGP